MTPPEGSRLAGPRRAKLRALVSDHWSGDAPLVDAADGVLPGGAALADGGSRRGWVLIDDGDPAGLGAALAWRRSHPVGELHLLVEDRADRNPGGGPASGVVARRAALFSDSPTVWRIEGRALARAEPLGADSSSLGRAPEGLSTADLDRLSAQISARGAVPITEHGVLRAEVLGLEVARAVTDAVGGWRLAVGVGRHDRDAREELRPGEPVDAALDDIVALVRQWRTTADRRHPTNTLARARLLRSVVIAHPELAGAVALTAVSSPLPAGDLRTPAPAGALGEDERGGAVVAVCSTGIDMDLVPTAADIRLVHAPEARLVLVLSAADVYPVTRDLAACLATPAEVWSVAPGWESLV